VEPVTNAAGRRPRRDHAQAAREPHHQRHRARRSELKDLTDRNDRQPGTEFNFKFYSQVTNKIVGIRDEAAAFLSEFFWYLRTVI